MSDVINKRNEVYLHTKKIALDNINTMKTGEEKSNLDGNPDIAIRNIGPRISNKQSIRIKTYTGNKANIKRYVSIGTQTRKPDIRKKKAGT